MVIQQPHASELILRFFVRCLPLCLISCVASPVQPPAGSPPTIPPPSVEVREALATPTVEVVELDGIERDRASGWLGRVRVALATCKPTTPGVARVRIETRGDYTDIRLIAPSALDADTLGCVMESLALLDEAALEQVAMEPPAATTQLSPSDSPPTVASQVVISW